MKKLVLSIAILLAGLTVSAQEGQFNAGANIGIPTGDSGDSTSIAYSIEANYLFEVSDAFKVGPSVSYLGYIYKSEIKDAADAGGYDLDSPAFLPIAAAGRFAASEQFTIGLDLGYAVGLNDGNDGGLYYRPLVGYNVSDSAMIQASYSGVSDDGFTASAISLGVVFGL